MGIFDSIKSTYAEGKAEYLQATEDMNVKSGTPHAFGAITGTGGATAKLASWAGKFSVGSKVVNAGSKVPSSLKLVPGSSLVLNNVGQSAEEAFDISLPTFDDVTGTDTDSITFTPEYEHDPYAKDTPVGLIVAAVAIGAIIILGGKGHGA